MCGTTTLTHRSWQPLLGPKKSPSQSIYIGLKDSPLGDSSWHGLPNLPKWADILA